MSESSENFYMVVEFPNEEEDESVPTAIVSSTWLFQDPIDKKNLCWWPNFRSDAQRKKAVIHHQDIDVDNCKRCDVNIKYKTDIYQKAVVKLKQLDSNSEFSLSEDNLARKRKRNRLFDEDSYKLSDVSGSSRSSQSLSPPTPPKDPSLLKKYKNKQGKKLTASSEKSDNKITKVTATETPITSTVTPITSTVTPVTSVIQEPIPIIIESVPGGEFTCTSCKKVEGLVTHILTAVQANSKKIDDLTHIVNASIHQKTDSTPVEWDGFPIKTIVDLNSFEQKLEAREEFIQMVNVFKLIGGKDTFDTIRIMDNSVAININWIGRNGKPAFKNFKNILSLISDSVRHNPLAKTCTEQEVHSIIKQWLRGAIDCGGGRQKRQKENR